MKIIAQLKAGNDFAGSGQAHCRPTRRPRRKAATSAGSGPRDMDPAFTNAVGAAEERRIHHDAGADRGRLARDPAAEHARPHAACVRRREGSPGQDRGGQELQDCTRTKC